jgi:Tol biopolymer transport system component
MSNPRNARTSLLHRLGVTGPARVRAFGGSGASKISRGTGASSRRLVLSLLLTTLGVLAFTAAPALATGDANSASCPSPTEASPGFRSFLPDCRAYEQVTPVFKDGTELDIAALSEDGSSLITRALAGFAGVESGSGSTTGDTYQLSRSASGWTVKAISPPSPSFSTSEFLAASTDLSRTLWWGRSPLESIAAENLFLRESDGAMVKIGSELPPSAVTGPPSNEYQPFLYFEETEFVGASGDLSHVLFEIHQGHAKGIAWPGDTTIGAAAKTSLYEYAGTGQLRPALVGVSDGSTVVPGENEGRPIPAGHLISECNTYLGSFESHDVYNAISADGGTVFFTAETGGCTAPRAGGEPPEVGEGPPAVELYARIDGEQTVQISEPSIGSGLACEACQEGERKDAEFAGASSDGSKVFFLTEQELLPHAKGMNLYEYDFDNTPASAVAPDGNIVRVSGGVETPEVQGVARVSEDGSHVYFVASGALTGPNREGDSPSTAPGADNLYLFQRDAAYPSGRLAFITTLAPGDSEDWSATDMRKVQATPDGQYLVFDSDADTPTVQQVFEYDAQSEELVRVSRGADNDASQGTLSADEHGGVILEPEYKLVDGPSAAASSLSISEDGATVLFESHGALTLGVDPAAPRGQASAYEYHSPVASGGSLSDGDVYLIAAEAIHSNSVALGLDESGRDSFVRTDASLVPQDTDTQLDLYDARTDGGFPAPDPPAGCEAACASVFAQPSPVTPASTNVTGNSSLTPPAVTSSTLGAPAVTKTIKSTDVKCKKGEIRKGKKCVRKLRPKAKKSNTERRTGR